MARQGGAERAAAEETVKAGSDGPQGGRTLCTIFHLALLLGGVWTPKNQGPVVGVDSEPFPQRKVDTLAPRGFLA